MTIAGSRSGGLRVLGLALAVSVLRPPLCRAEDPGPCGGESGFPPPAAGHYKGTFKLVYDLVLPGVPPELKFQVTWAGDLEYDLGRSELSDAPPPLPPPPPPLRNPLRPPRKDAAAPAPPDRAAPGQFESDAAQVEAYWENERMRIERNEALVQKLLKELAAKTPPAHMYVPKNWKPTIKGKASGKVEAKMAGMSDPDVNVQGSGHSTEPVVYDLEAEERDPAEGFRRINLKGIPGQTGFAAHATGTSPDARATVDNKSDKDGGLSGHSKGETTAGTGEGDLSKPGGGSRDKGPVLVAALEVHSTECWTMRGEVDPAEIRRMLQASQPGADIKVVESEWSARLEERDEAFERKVDELAAEPIPAEMTWEYFDSFRERWAALRAGAAPLSDYKLCVLKKLERKFVKINLVALRTLTRSFPKASEGATCAVMRAAMERMMQHVRVLQLYGAGDCPEVKEADAVSTREMQALLKTVLARKYTWEDLKCFMALDAFGKLGDWTEAYESAVEAMVVENEARKAAEGAARQAGGK